MTAAPKTIQTTLRTDQPHMVGDGFRVFNYFSAGSPYIKALSPFILLDYNAPYNFPPAPQHPKGVGAHPHRGFETVTIVYEGALAHRDSTGSGGVIQAGDVQWMTAASGVLHEEFHEKNFAASGGILHAIQLWVNLPAADKKLPPQYQTLLSDAIPSFKIDEKGSQLRIIAGEFKGIKGAASTHTPIQMYDIRLKKDQSLDLSLPSTDNTLLLVTQGSFIVNDQPASFKDLLVFSRQGEKITLKANEDAMACLLSGTPIDEPIVSSGPFVMNTEQEIVQAYKDFKEGRFGSL